MQTAPNDKLLHMHHLQDKSMSALNKHYFQKIKFSFYQCECVIFCVNRPTMLIVSI